MKALHFIVVLLFSCAIALGTTVFVERHSSMGTHPESSPSNAFDRIVKTNTLRCGYAVASPWFMVDPNSKTLSGVAYDITNAVADKIGVKVDWVEETGWGVAEVGLITGRYDMLCGSVCIDPRRAKAATFSTPFLHLPILATVRENDHRFDNGLSGLNTPDVRIGVKTGHVFEFIANEQFPRAQKVYASDLSDDTEFFQMLRSHKIDIAFSGQTTIDNYNAKNDFKVRSLDEPVRFCNGAFMLPLNDTRLKFMIDNAIVELNSNGQIRQILNRFIGSDPRYGRAPALPFQER